MLADAGRTRYTTTGLTNSQSVFHFEVPQAFLARYMGGPGLLEAPTNPVDGRYTVHATLQDAWSTADDETTYTVNVP